MEDLKKYKTLCVPNYKTNPTHLVLIVDYKWWVNDQLLKVADLALHPKFDWPVWQRKQTNREGEDEYIKSRRTIYKTITCYARDTGSKTVNQRPQDNQRKRVISNNIGDPRDELYRNVIQDRLPQD